MAKIGDGRPPTPETRSHHDTDRSESQHVTAIKRRSRSTFIGSPHVDVVLRREGHDSGSLLVSEWLKIPQSCHEAR